MQETHAESFRCDLRSFVLDLLDFMEEQIEQALSDPADQRAAVDAASGVVPILRRRLASGPEPESQAIWASCVLAPGNEFEDRYWRKVWDDLSMMPAEKFTVAARVLVETIDVLREVVRTQLG